MLKNRRQIMAAIGTEGTFGTYTAQQAADNANLIVYDVKSTTDVSKYERNPNRATLGSLASVIGSSYGKVTFKAELCGSGVAGTAPAWGRLLRACGFSETINTGTASSSHTMRKSPAQAKSTVSIFTLASAISGSFTGTKSGTWRILLKSGVNSTSATFNATFFPGDGTAATSGDFTYTNATGQVIGLGLTLTPAISGALFSGTTWRVGDEWYFDAVSSSQVEVVYLPISDSIPCLDLAVYEDGRIKKFHSARGNMKLAGKVGEILIADFEFWGILNASADVIVDGALLSSIPFQDVVAPAFKNLTATLYSATPQTFTNFELDLGNTLAVRKSALSATGCEVIRLTDRNVTGKIDTLACIAATFNPFSQLLAGTTGNLILQVGATSGNIVLLEASRVQIENVGDDEIEGESVDTLDLRFCEPEYEATGAYQEIKITAK